MSCGVGTIVLDIRPQLAYDVRVSKVFHPLCLFKNVELWQTLRRNTRRNKIFKLQFKNV